MPLSGGPAPTHDVEPKPFRKPAVVDDSQARLLLAGIVALLFVIVFVAEAIGCAHYCKDLHDVKDTFEPFAAIVFTAVGSVLGFYFADKLRRD